MLRVSALSSNYRAMASILIVDAPGFRNPAHCGRSTGATFEDLCHNYVQERLQLLFHDTVFTSKQDLYAQVSSFFLILRVGNNATFCVMMMMMMMR